MNKKGMEALAEWIVHLVLLLLVITTLLSVSYKIKDNKLHQLRVESRDFALTRDILTTSPYNLEYRYNPRENITLLFNEENCLVQAKYKDDPNPLKYFCGIDNLNKLQQIELDKTIKVTK